MFSHLSDVVSKSVNIQSNDTSHSVSLNIINKNNTVLNHLEMIIKLNPAHQL